MEERVDVKTDIEKASKPNRGPGVMSKVISVVILAVLCAVSGGGVFLWQHHQVNNLDAQLTSLTASDKALSKQKSDLDDKNTSLSKSLQQLQQEVANAQQNATSEKILPPAPPSPSGKFVITAFKDNELLSDFNTPQFTFSNPSTVIMAVYITMTNLTDSTQSYIIDQFYGTSSTGVIVPTVRYALSQTPKVWWQSQITAGGSENIVLLWPEGTDIKTLSWTPPGGTATYTTPLPAPTTN